jgi:hypothetical protein
LGDEGLAEKANLAGRVGKADLPGEPTHGARRASCTSLDGCSLSSHTVFAPIVYDASMKLRSLVIPVIALTATLTILYVADDLSVRYRVPRGRQPFGTVTIRRYDAISEKNNKTEFVFENPVTVTCVHSFFPHMGYQPCWYLSRHAEQRINY